ncbi:Uncharacterised protein [Mycobacteroides abscessus subsp. bolletii]|uniref:DUF4145 domain-containing protein n=1 Tax=Mycobacteroides abscessus TaxID=36809 RepID=UPI000926ABAD|nr:DUF4145 domain-containing protein [Mycobacteroides abscessus]SHY85686.1 Uncharacterised protein [Mycobacteroides abscessus subsp. bolletii]SKQ60578.1 Uncharacterised protein [Mycobacteroides abscessus subsp. bolletii]SKQ62147.1 Uncharacterised protein [Mycobacteroides abscessus subsp. bolletii]SKQ64926.1 Uncharacterised protein [Mycobacteroides abscessus subsp. bolletii]
MPNHLCWLCKSNTGHNLVVDPVVLGLEAPYFDGRRLLCGAFRCSVCRAISIALTGDGDDWVRVSDLPGSAFTWIPETGDTRTYPHVPDHIASAAQEAFECGNRGKRRAAIMLARAVIEATAKYKGITKGNLKDKIDALAAAQLIRPHIKEIAHGVRLFGNDMAHGDFVAPVSSEESDLVIELMGEILNEVFQSPAKLAAVQQALAQRAGPQQDASALPAAAPATDAG